MTWKFCPHCGGKLPQDQPTEGTPRTNVNLKVNATINASHDEQPMGKEKYNQLAVWKKLQEGCRHSIDSGEKPIWEMWADGARQCVRDQIVLSGTNARTLIHLAFDRNIIPLGGALHKAAASDGRMADKLEMLTEMGYASVDGKVQIVDDVPVGPIYGALMYWAGEKQHKRWHMTRPVEVNPSRMGDPLMMDENMVCFSVAWADSERVAPALLNLLELLEKGFVDAGGMRPIGVAHAFLMIAH